MLEYIQDITYTLGHLFFVAAVIALSYSTYIIYRHKSEPNRQIKPAMIFIILEIISFIILCINAYLTNSYIFFLVYTVLAIGMIIVLVVLIYHTVKNKNVTAA